MQQVIRLEDLPKLPLEQLRMVKQQVDGEVEAMQESLMNLNHAINRLNAADEAVQNLTKKQPGNEILVPLTSSLYVPGVLGSLDKLVVDIGAKYYVEKSPADTSKYCRKKIEMLKENQNKLAEAVAEKSQISQQVTSVLQAKLRAAMSQQQMA